MIKFILLSALIFSSSGGEYVETKGCGGSAVLHGVQTVSTYPKKAIDSN